MVHNNPDQIPSSIKFVLIVDEFRNIYFTGEEEKHHVADSEGTIENISRNNPENTRVGHFQFQFPLLPDLNLHRIYSFE
ncbi:hypothetical protein TNCT_9261 [Trichonephila clavata]|uniref:Uncharacterized protein n=1 Tax=Trichonephila clavata TaxID=2740835 RepID=A0A8X6GZA3_TRICU|nr:hypothetical protein TNCT_9261 [Trichonephila clavata]